MISPLPGSEDLLTAVRTALRTPAPPLVIGIDGGFGSGTASISLWLGWQLGMPVVHTDLFTVRGTHPIEWRYDELERVVRIRTQFKAPVIVQGLCLRRVLQAINHDSDYLIWVEYTGTPIAANDDPTGSYMKDFRPDKNADYRLRWKV